MNANEKLQAGLKVRREVLGEEYVAAALEKAGPCGAPLQELVTEFCWGAVWARDGLDRRTRSLVNVAMISALNRPNEVRIHLEGALNNGCTAAELREVVLQISAYCGMPAALDTFRVLREVLAERGEEPKA
jgi:4-carboxymuconolactone decarboxylase